MNLEIAWHNITPSPTVESDVNRRFEKLCTFCGEVTSARITLDQPHHPNARPHRFSVTLEVHLPHTTIMVDHACSEEEKADLHLLIHHTFDAARRRIQDYRRVRQGKVKRHSVPDAPPVPDIESSPG